MNNCFVKIEDGYRTVPDRNEPKTFLMKRDPSGLDHRYQQYFLHDRN